MNEETMMKEIERIFGVALKARREAAAELGAFRRDLPRQAKGGRRTP